MGAPQREATNFVNADTLRAAFDGAGLAMIVTGPELQPPGPVILSCNAAMEALTGYGTREMVGQTPRMLQGPRTDRATLARAKADLLQLGRFEGEAVNYRKDGTEYLVEWHITAIHDGDGVLRGWLGIQRDVTQRRQAGAALLAAEARQRALLEGIPQLVWRARSGGEWTWCSPQWSAYTGLSEEESRGHGWLAAVHPEDRTLARLAWADAATGMPFQMNGRLFHAGERRYRWYQSQATPVRVEGEDATEWLGTSTDIDDLKTLQGQQQVLVAELQHRTRNLLGVVRSLARRSIDASPGRDQYDARLAALSRVQSFLSRSSLYVVKLADLVDAELHAAGDGTSDRVEVGGPPVELPGEGVQTMALALHELATNAVKYGAIAQPSGRLAVSWRVEPGNDRSGERLVIDWRESGVAMPAGLPRREGYGSELITRALPYQLRADSRLEFTPDGVWCRITLPASMFTAGTDP